MNVHDFPSDALGQAVPYGIYDVIAALGAVFIGLSAGTAEFAVASIVGWWQVDGRWRYPGAKRLLILADSGGANGCRVRLWREQLQRQLADVFSLEVVVCHYPTGCSKWNPVEHRLFGPISQNWAGIPLRTVGTMVALIQGTETTKGQAVRATVLGDTYEVGRKISDRFMNWLDVRPHEVCPQWNYTFHPRPLSGPVGIGSFERIMPWDLALIH